MGNQELGDNPQQRPNTNIPHIAKNSFEFISVIGKGGFGKVWKVMWKKNKELFAMKEMSKAKVIDKKSVQSILSERQLLSKMNHPFIVNMRFSFQEKDFLYLAMDIQVGGDLRYHLIKVKRFTEEQSKFFMACIILGYEYFHSNNIVHRDMKPENLVLDKQGYVRITDFGVAKDTIPVPKTVTSGTPGYMAPEVMCSQPHGIAADYFALGVMGFEFMKGIRPYLGKSRKEIKEKIMSHQVQIKKFEVPEGWSQEAADFINRLLQRKQPMRLGYHGAEEVKNHEWLRDYPWADLYNFKLNPPFKPKVQDNYDSKFCNRPENIDIETKSRYENIMFSKEYETAFVSYVYFNSFDIPIDYEFYNNPHVKYLRDDEQDNSNKYKHRRPSSMNSDGANNNQEKICVQRNPSLNNKQGNNAGKTNKN